MAIFITAIAAGGCNAVAGLQQQGEDFGAMQTWRMKIWLSSKWTGTLLKPPAGVSGGSCSMAISSEWLNITSNMHDEPRTINVNLCGTSPGNYAIDDVDPGARSHGAFFPDYIGDMTNGYAFIKAVFNITSIDTIKGIVNGKFSGTVRNMVGQTLEITDGRIVNGSLKAGVTRYWRADQVPLRDRFHLVKVEWLWRNPARKGGIFLSPNSGMGKCKSGELQKKDSAPILRFQNH